MNQTQAKKEKSVRLGMIVAIYLFGIFMGAIDTGIVTPARTIIQNNLNVDDKTGIWMITIYTLAYAASIPVMGKLADKFGRKMIYLTSIFLFGMGSLFCGLSQDFHSFTLLIIARSVQAIGGGGIMPVATAEFGTSFPPEKRGMALGLVGGVYGIANIFGSSVGSGILNIFGVNNWQFIFYVNVPISIFVIIAGIAFLQNNKVNVVKKIDKWGILLIVLMVLSLLYGLRNIDFFNFWQTLRSTNVYPFLLAFLIMLPLFILAEKRAEDPVINLSYFVNPRIITTLVLSFIVGIVMMGMIFVPQFSENALKIATGSGGYFIIILGVFAGVGAPLSGRLIDRYGAKLILAIGFVFTIIGSLFLVFVTTSHPSMLTVSICLILIGLGMGFTIGTPLNYMMLENTKKEESNSALATLSLIRSIGTAIAPAIMIGFLAHAGGQLQTNLVKLLPQQVSVPSLPYAKELNDKITALKSDPNMKDKLSGFTFPDLTAMTTVKIDLNKKGEKLSADLIDLLKTADVTTITARTKILSTRMFEKTTPSIVSNITNGIDKGIVSIEGGIPSIEKNSEDMTKAIDGVLAGIVGMQKAISGIETGETQLNAAIAQQETALTQMNAFYEQVKNIPVSPQWPVSLMDMIPPAVKATIPTSVLDQLKDVKTPADLKAKIDALSSAITSLKTQVVSMEAQKKQLNANLATANGQKAGLQKALDAMTAAKADMKDTVNKMTILKNAVPTTFQQANTNYLKEIDKLSPKLQTEFQSTLNNGFKQIYLTTSISAFIALLILMLYKKKKTSEEQ